MSESLEAALENIKDELGRLEEAKDVIEERESTLRNIYNDLERELATRKHEVPALRGFPQETPPQEDFHEGPNLTPIQKVINVLYRVPAASAKTLAEIQHDVEEKYDHFLTTQKIAFVIQELPWVRGVPGTSAERKKLYYDSRVLG